MPRKVQRRVSYHNDAQFLIRTGKAVLKDDRLPLAKRHELDRRLRDLAMDLLGALDTVKAAPAGGAVSPRTKISAGE